MSIKPTTAKSLKLFIDDLRNPYDKSWSLVRTYAGVKSHIEENGMPKVISFDHDLTIPAYREFDRSKKTGVYSYTGLNEATGLDAMNYIIAKLMEDKNVSIPDIIIHTANETGARNLRLKWQMFIEMIGETSSIEVVSYSLESERIARKYEKKEEL